MAIAQVETLIPSPTTPTQVIELHNKVTGFQFHGQLWRPVNEADLIPGNQLLITFIMDEGEVPFSTIIMNKQLCTEDVFIDDSGQTHPTIGICYHLAGLPDEKAVVALEDILGHSRQSLRRFYALEH